jgi:two-component system, NarL family, nitrate/nitrite response regulator NarL
MTGPDKLRVILADDHTLFRKSLASLLADRADMEVVGDAENGLEAIRLTRELSPDLVLMDVHMPDGDGIEAVRAIKQEMPGVKIVMLSAFDDDDDLFAAIKSGANGYLLKNLPPSQLFVFLDGVRRGEAAICGALADRILQEFRHVHAKSESCQTCDALTPKEIETLELLVQGKTNKQIAAALFVSENTVKRHLWEIMEKLHFQNRTQLAIYAVHRGLGERPAR